MLTALVIAGMVAILATFVRLHLWLIDRQLKAVSEAIHDDD